MTRFKTRLGYAIRKHDHQSDVVNTTKHNQCSNQQACSTIKICCHQRCKEKTCIGVIQRTDQSEEKTQGLAEIHEHT